MYRRQYRVRPEVRPEVGEDPMDHSLSNEAFVRYDVPGGQDQNMIRQRGRGGRDTANGKRLFCCRIVACYWVPN
jgi:hypothetical protein